MGAGLGLLSQLKALLIAVLSPRHIPLGGHPAPVASPRVGDGSLNGVAACWRATTRVVSAKHCRRPVATQQGRCASVHKTWGSPCHHAHL